MMFTETSILLALETSCDETAAAVLRGKEVLSNVISSQVIHSKYGGVIPEFAAREHLKTIVPVVQTALEQAHVTMADVHGIAVTAHPGLAGALVVGTSFAKGLALRYGLPIVAVNHIEGHIFSALLEHTALTFPFVALVVSGGHTSVFDVRSFEDYRVIGSTRDDAAGEAFDKIAKLLGLGYPGGAKIDALASSGNPRAVQFPRGMMQNPRSGHASRSAENFDFSFSGLKTAVRTHLQKHFGSSGSNELHIPPEVLPDLCASAQEAIAEVLTEKTLRAATHLRARSIVVAGGVAANSRLRALLTEGCASGGFQLFVPSMQFCTDNAAMIGLVGREKLLHSVRQDMRFTIGTSALRAATRIRQEVDKSR